jgi:hypothetical protein
MFCRILPSIKPADCKHPQPHKQTPSANGQNSFALSPLECQKNAWWAAFAIARENQMQSECVPRDQLFAESRSLRALALFADRRRG